MSELRAKPSDLCMADAMPFNQHYEYRTTWPLSELLHDRFFLPVRDQLRAGDQITLCRFDSTDERSKQLVEIVAVRVKRAGRGHDTVPLHAIGRVEIVAEAGQAAGALSVARGFAGKWRVMKGETLVSEYGSRVEAEEAMNRLAA